MRGKRCGGRTVDEALLTHLIDQAQLALDGGDYLRAADLTDQLLPHAEEFPEILGIRAHALLQLNRLQEAWEAARAHARLVPDDWRVQRQLAEVAWHSRRLGCAQQAWEEAVRLSDQDPDILAEYAWFMAVERSPRLALEAAVRAKERDENSSLAWSALGLAQLRLHRRQEAEASLGRALKLDPNEPRAQFAMLSFLQEVRRNESALALSRLLEDTPGTEPIVRDVRRQVQRRLLARKLVERGIAPGPSVREPPWWRWFFLGFGGFTAGWLLLLMRPQSVHATLLCVLVPLLVGALLTRLFSK